MMERFTKGYSTCLTACLLAFSVAGCSKVADDTPDDVICTDGYISFSPSLSSNGDPSGEDVYNENKFTALDLFIYDENATDDDAALLHHHETLTGEAGIPTVKVPTGELAALLAKGSTSFKAVAIANCSEVAASENDKLSLNALKAFETGASTSFRAATAPEAFVMHSLDKPVTVTVDKDGYGKKTYALNFKRLAAKIRVALSVKESFTDGYGVEWRPDVGQMRLYISNGVGTSRLDGDSVLGDIAQSDYYNISASENMDTEDDGFARALTYHATNYLSGKQDVTYLYYNDIPYYTYPNQWSSGSTAEHRTSLVVVIPWINENGNDAIYQPTYYIIPVNNDGIVISDSFYYVRARIETMGSHQYDAPIQADALYMKASQWIIYDNDVALW